MGGVERFDDNLWVHTCFDGREVPGDLRLGLSDLVLKDCSSGVVVTVVVRFQ